MLIKEIISKSAKDFQDIVWPRLKDKIGGGKIIPVETVTDNIFAKEIDTLAGIDAWHIYKNGMGMRGIASRVQWRINNGKIAPGFGKYGYQTFTIRHKLANGGNTEYQKRMYAINSDVDRFLFPDLTIQAYLENPEGEFLSAAVIQTRELFEIIMTHPQWNDYKIVAGGNEMLVIKWSDIKQVSKSIIYLSDFTMDLFLEES